MKSNLNSFQNLFIYFFVILFLLIHCQNNDKNIISENNFIEIYAQIYIINEIHIDKESQLLLINDLLKQYNRTLDDVRYSLDYYNERPEKWLQIVERIKNKIRESDRKKEQKTLKEEEKKKPEF